MRAAGQVERFERELAEIVNRVDGHNRSLGREFDRVVDVLTRRGYISQSERHGDQQWSLTAKGTMLASVFHESDLLIAECLSFGYLDDVDAPALAGLLSTFVYEHRSPEPPAPPWFTNDLARKRWRSIQAASEDLAADEQSSELGVHRAPDPGFFAAAHAWTAGHELGTVVGDEELTGGDFVRTMKQLIDLARQVADVAPSSATRDVAREVATLAFRGIVADGTLSGVDEEVDDAEGSETELVSE
jgi:ATP-dependent RNA helicase HelY